MFNYYYFLLAFYGGLSTWLLTKHKRVGILALTLTAIEYLRIVLQILFH